MFAQKNAGYVRFMRRAPVLLAHEWVRPELALDANANISHIGAHVGTHISVTCLEGAGCLSPPALPTTHPRANNIAADVAAQTLTPRPPTAPVSMRRRLSVDTTGVAISTGLLTLTNGPLWVPTQLQLPRLPPRWSDAPQLPPQQAPALIPVPALAVVAAEASPGPMDTTPIKLESLQAPQVEVKKKEIKPDSPRVYRHMYHETLSHTAKLQAVREAKMEAEQLRLKRPKTAKSSRRPTTPLSPDRPPQQQAHLAPFMAISDSMLQRLVSRISLGASDTVLDAGCGEGKILIELLKSNPKANGVGVEISPALTRTAIKNAAAAGVGSRATFFAADIRDSSIDLSTVTAVVSFFVPYGLRVIFPSLLERLAPGTHIFTLLHSVPGDQPSWLCSHGSDTLHEYVVPSRAAA